MSNSGLPNAEEWRERRRGLAPEFVRIAMENLNTEYPHAAIGSEVEDVPFPSPRKRHPVFFGAFDWHSAVHNYWLLLRHLSLSLEEADREEICRMLGRCFTPENLALEVNFLERPGNRSFERPYGLGWLLLLVGELRCCKVPEASHWLEQFLPLEQLAMERLEEYFRTLSWPVRAGTHHNTAFSMWQVLKCARKSRMHDLAEEIERQGIRLFRNDQDYNPRYEPGGEDFLSPALCEICLMADLLSGPEFQGWFKRFLPNRYSEDLPWLQPVLEFNDSDGRMVHLAGLNLSRAWCLYELIDSGHLGPALEIKWELQADPLLITGLDQLEAGGYRGRHWIPTFATMALEGRLRVGDR